MNNMPDWLPAIVSVDGNFDEVIMSLYRIFKRDFIDNQPHYMSIPVWHDRRKNEGEKYEEGFWHLLTRDFKNISERQFDPRRAERLPWCSPTINNCNDSSVKVWDYKGQRRTTTYIWLEDLDYVVLLQLRNLRTQRIAFLITAYHVDGASVRRSLRRKYEKRIS
jgi:hypothetical protein